MLHGKQEDNFVSSCKGKTHFFLFFGVGKEGSVFVIDRLQKYEFYFVYFLIDFLEVLHSDIFYPSITYWNTVLYEEKKYNNSQCVK